MAESKIKLEILHVLTLNGSSGEYGGPNKVASELGRVLQSRGHGVRVFTGALSKSLPDSNNGLNEMYEIARPLFKTFPISSLWSTKLSVRLFKLIKEVDLVHIHFGRELIPVAAAFICILLKKPYVTQTHGMVVKDNRLSTQIFDFLFTRFALNHSSLNLVLSGQELTRLIPFKFKCEMKEVPNGIQPSKEHRIQDENRIPKIVFCSRLHARKRPDRFLGLVKFAHQNGIEAKFSIYGVDGGELKSTLQKIESDPELSCVTYEGSLPPARVMDVLSECDLLVLPSENEPFPMIVLEALSVGTRALIMPSSGIADLLKVHFPEMVAETDNEDGLNYAFSKLCSSPANFEEIQAIKIFCETFFGIEKVVDRLETFYLESV